MSDAGTPTQQKKVTPLNAGVKPMDKSVLANKRAFVLHPHLTHRPFEELRVLLTSR